MSIDREKAKFQKEAQVYRSFQENLDIAHQRLLLKQETKAEKAQRYAEDQKRLFEETQTKRQLLNRKREEVKKRHYETLKAHSAAMQQSTHSLRRLSPRRMKPVTASNSPKRLRLAAEESSQELLRNIEEKLAVCSRRSVELKQSCKERLKKHSEKVNLTLNFTLQSEARRQANQLLKVAQKHSGLIEWTQSKRFQTKKHSAAARSLTEEKLQRALQTRSALKRQEAARLDMLEAQSQAKLKAACESFEAIQREIVKEKTDKQQIRKSEQQEKYEKQLRLLVICTQQAKKTKVLEKDQQSSFILSLLKQQKLTLVDTKVKDDLELKRQREEARERRLRPSSKGSGL